MRRRSNVSLQLTSGPWERRPRRRSLSAPLAYAPALLRQDSAYAYRVWITLNKPLSAPLQHPKINPYIHQSKRLCVRLLPAVRRVSEKNYSRQLGE